MNEKNKEFLQSDAGKAWLGVKATEGRNPYIVSIFVDEMEKRDEALKTSEMGI